MFGAGKASKKLLRNTFFDRAKKPKAEKAFAHAQPILNRHHQRLEEIGLDHKFVDNCFHVIGERLVHLKLFAQVNQFIVDAQPTVALGTDLAKEIGVIFAIDFEDGRVDLDQRADRERENMFGNLHRCARRHFGATVGAVGGAGSGEEDAEVVIDVGHGADRRAGVATDRLLFNRNYRREAIDCIDLGLLQLGHKFARKGRERLQKAALPLGVDRLKGERRFARSTQPGHDDQLVTGDLDINVLQVVLPCALDRNRLSHSSLLVHWTITWDKSIQRMVVEW